MAPCAQKTPLAVPNRMREKKKKQVEEKFEVRGEMLNGLADDVATLSHLPTLIGKRKPRVGGSGQNTDRVFHRLTICMERGTEDLGLGRLLGRKENTSWIFFFVTSWQPGGQALAGLGMQMYNTKDAIT